MPITEFFAYTEPKSRVYQSFRLSLFRMVFDLVVVSYILGYQMWYKGAHYKVHGIQGVHRLQWQQPTRGWCNPAVLDCEDDITSLAELPYCNSYTGHNTSLAKKDCVVKDAWDLPIQMPLGVLMPSFIQRFTQKLECHRGVHHCNRKYRFTQAVFDEDVPKEIQRGDDKAAPSDEYYVASVEDYTLLIDHSFSALGGSVAWAWNRMQGYWNDCRLGNDKCVRKPIRCIHKRCVEFGFEHSEPKDRGPVFAIAYGDVLSIKTILAMAESASMDMPLPTDGRGYTMDDIVNTKNQTRRERGAVVDIEVHYHNNPYWRSVLTQSPPEYTLSVTISAEQEYKHIFVTASGLQDDENREVTRAYGTFVVIHQVGTIQTLDWPHFVIVLVTFVSLFRSKDIVIYAVLRLYGNSNIFQEAAEDSTKDSPFIPKWSCKATYETMSGDQMEGKE